MINSLSLSLKKAKTILFKKKNKKKFCLRIIPRHRKETIAYTNSTNSTVDVYRKFFIPRSFLQILLKLQPSDILHVFFTGIIPKYCIPAHPVPVRFCIEKIFHSMEIFILQNLLNSLIIT